MNKRLKTILSILMTVITAAAVMIGRPVVVSAANVTNETALKNLADSGGTAKLTADILLSEMLVVPSGKKLTIDLNGKTLDRGLTECTEDGSVICVEAGATLIVKDTTNTNAGIITENSALYGGGILSVSGASLVFRNGSYSKLENGKTVKAVTYMTITGNKAGDGSGIFSAGELSITGGAELSGNQNNDDIYLGDGVKIVCGELTFQTPAGLRAYGNDPTPRTPGQQSSAGPGAGNSSC